MTQVKEYLELEDPELDAGTSDRLEMKVQFARETSTTILRSGPIIKIQITMPAGKQQHCNHAWGGCYCLPGQQGGQVWHQVCRPVTIKLISNALHMTHTLFLPLFETGKMHAMPNMSGIVAWLCREFRCVSGVILLVLNFAHHRHRILGEQGDLGAHDWWN